MSHPPQHTIDLPTRPGRWHVRRHPTDPWVEVEVVEVHGALGFEAWGSRCGWEHAVLAGFQWGGKVAPKITFSTPGDEDAKRAAAVLHALGFDVERVDGETRAPVGLRLDELAGRFKLSSQELAVVALACAGHDRAETAELMDKSKTTVKWLRRSVELKAGCSLADLVSQLRSTETPLQSFWGLVTAIPMGEALMASQIVGLMQQAGLTQVENGRISPPAPTARKVLRMCADGIGCDAPEYDEPLFPCALCGTEPPPIHGYG